jgi:hypothetical protein
MADKVYEVLPDQKYSGRHKVYTQGQQFPESELRGSLEYSLKGDPGKFTEDEDGNEIVLIRPKDAKIKLVVSKEEKKVSAPKRGRPSGSTTKDKG